MIDIKFSHLNLHFNWFIFIYIKIYKYIVPTIDNY